MSYTAVPTVATGDAWSASLHNTYVRDNFAATVPDALETKGDMVVATAANNMDNLAVGANAQTLVANSAETLGVTWGGFTDIATTGKWECSTFTDCGVDSYDGNLDVITAFGLPAGTKIAYGCMSGYNGNTTARWAWSRTGTTSGTMEMNGYPSGAANPYKSSVCGFLALDSTGGCDYYVSHKYSDVKMTLFLAFQ